MDFDLPTKSVLGLVTLLGLRGVGKQTALKLAHLFPVLAEIPDAPESQIAPLVTKATLQTIRDRAAWDSAYSKAQGELHSAENHNVRIVSLFDDCYPVLLRLISDPPPVIYMKGVICPGRRNVACVGTRHPTWFGTEVTKRLVGMLVSNGWCIVSGLAKGIDAESHRAALRAGGQTVAVLANGLDSVYPRENHELAEEILAAGGGWMSEQPIGTRAYAQHLVDRDRMQSGMSIATFVMQTGIVGGTMHTVRFTLAQRRLLFAPVPTPTYENEEQSQGIRAITGQSAAQLVHTLRAKGEYRNLLESHFQNHPPAIPIYGKHDYESMLCQLDQALAESEGSNGA